MRDLRSSLSNGQQALSTFAVRCRIARSMLDSRRRTAKEGHEERSDNRFNEPPGRQERQEFHNGLSLAFLAARRFIVYRYRKAAGRDDARRAAPRASLPDP